MAEVARIFTVEKRGVGLPDYAAPKPVGAVPIGPIYTSTDIAELAARLDSINTFDRRGNVIWMDGFEDGIKRMSIVGDDAFGMSWDADYPFHGGYSLKLWTDAAAWKETYVSAHCPYPTLSKIGFEVAFRPDNKLSNLWLLTDMYDDTYRHRGAVIYTPETGVWTFYNAAGGFTALSPAVSIPINHFSIIKVVCDYTIDEYIRLIVNNTTFNLEGEGIRRTTDGAGPYLGSTVNIINGAAGASTCYIDNMILTQQEPPND